MTLLCGRPFSAPPAVLRCLPVLNAQPRALRAPSTSTQCSPIPPIPLRPSRLNARP
ncbi:hypothetical protein N658DRAFT_498977 [Parathielavia hyrcaniae]|uniref:Uncharacterized protein n=1 Tax=Parathielavia hyrcaniae TaxID=113614 RepID=A0AAN6PZG4_9PEZI|nr:hypothetical protein N658DRAFT_498977 [Parathielavia hyrcaniae]